ncbi:MAG: hypothetical protein H6713_27375 [Myxococcales bacterium]|nr:hypothetical protein [Myxococcales bacterium]
MGPGAARSESMVTPSRTPSRARLVRVHARARARAHAHAHARIVGALAWAAGGLAQAAPTEPLELEHALVSSKECASCHLFFNPPELADQPNISPQAYTGSMMANAARDPVFWADVAIAHQDAPGETEDCVRCHAPRAFLEGRGDAISIDELAPTDLEGVTCELCHRMLDDGVTPPGDARYVIDDLAVGGLVPRRGPWAYAPEDDPEHPTSDDNALLESGELCGTCHDVTTARERVDDDGQPVGALFNEQRTYREWLYSDYSGGTVRSCQYCHMPPLLDVAGCDAFNLAKKTHPTGGRRHDLVGINLGVMRLVQAMYGDAGTGELDDGYFELSRARVADMQAQSAKLKVEFPAELDLTAGVPALPVTVINETGHKLPTGYSEGRVMWLEFTATYGDAVIYGSGRWDARARAIEADAQVRRYEAIAEEYGTGVRHHLLRNNHWIVDNRIPPRGLIKNLETDPVGDRYALQENDTWPGRDAFSYSFPPAQVVSQGPEVAAEVTLRVRLLYLVNTPEYVEFLEAENVTNAAGSELAALFEDHGAPEPALLGEQEVTVPLLGLLPPVDDGGESDASTGDAGTGDSGSDGDPSAGTGETGETESSTGSAAESSGDSDSGGSDAMSGGCACAHAPSTAPTSALWLLALVGLRRRARR